MAAARALGIQPEVCHLNEGHAAFAVLERARSFMEETGQPFEVALAVTRAGNLFTTHTAVAAGFDRFAPALIEQYLGGMPKRSSASHSTICWPWAARTRTTRRSLSTWRIWQSAGAGR
jgi:glucan phosphorylase